MTARSRASAALGSALLVMTGSCSSGLGDFCYDDSDCKAGFLCSATGQRRGVCTYPEGTADAGVDQGHLDLSPADSTDSAAFDLHPDAAPDASVDAAAVDLSLDAAVPDLSRDSTPDARNDLPPDAAAADASAKDQSVDLGTGGADS